MAATACFFFWSAALVAACFCEAFFWFDFGDLSPMILAFFPTLTGPAECLFLRRDGTLALTTRVVKRDGDSWDKRDGEVCSKAFQSHEIRLALPPPLSHLV